MMAGILLIALLLASNEPTAEQMARQVAAAAAQSTVDQTIVDQDPGKVHVVGFKVRDGAIVKVDPIDAVKRPYLAFGRFCEDANTFIDGSFLVPGETPQQFVDRNRRFVVVAEPVTYARCMPVGMETTWEGAKEEGKPTINDSVDRLASHLLIWAEFLRNHDADKDRWRGFLIAALQQERAALGDSARSRDVAGLAGRLGQFDRSDRTTLLAGFAPRDAAERQALTEYLTFIVRARRKLAIFYPEAQRELLARDEEMLAKTGASR